MVNRRKVCFATATRAEYGLLRPLMQWVGASDMLERQVVATGAHLSPEFGLTWRHIVADGIAIDERFEIVLSSDTEVGVCKSMGLALAGFADAFDRLKPDLLVVLGDRYEMLAAASAATVLNIPVAHLHGGEVTEGAIDEAFRHSITKMSHLHFTSTAAYRQRVIQLGERPDTVFDVGAIGLDSVHGVPLLDRAALSASVGADLSGPFYLVTYHPETVTAGEHTAQIDTLLDTLLRVDGPRVLITGANADAGGRAINQRIEHWRDRFPDRITFVASLGQQRYLSAMKLCRAVVGNSSSGIIEAPGFRVPTLDIGRRQHGRIRAESVVNVPLDPRAMLDALARMASPAFTARLAAMHNPYGDGGTAERIGREIVRQFEHGITFQKSFHDISPSQDTHPDTP